MPTDPQAVEPHAVGCSVCKDKVHWSAPAELVVLWFHAQERPVSLRVNDQELVCRLGCSAVMKLFDIAAEQAPESQSMPWEYGLAVFRDKTLAKACNPHAIRTASA